MLKAHTLYLYTPFPLAPPLSSPSSFVIFSLICMYRHPFSMFTKVLYCMQDVYKKLHQDCVRNELLLLFFFYKYRWFSLPRSADDNKTLLILGSLFKELLLWKHLLGYFLVNVLNTRCYYYWLMIKETRQSTWFYDWDMKGYNNSMRFITLQMLFSNNSAWHILNVKLDAQASETAVDIHCHRHVSDGGAFDLYCYFIISRLLSKIMVLLIFNMWSN